MVPKRKNRPSKRTHGIILLKSRCTDLFCGEQGKKPIAPVGREYCYQGPVTKKHGCAQKQWMEALPDSGWREFQIEVGVQIWSSLMSSL